MWIGVHVLILFVAVPLILSPRLLGLDAGRLPHQGGERREHPVVWTLAIILTKFLGATLYYFLRYRNRGHLRTAESSDPAV